jgi:hypothetical protein
MNAYDLEEKLHNIIFRTIWTIKRTRCFIKGCGQSHESSWNMPDDWHSPTSCNYCDACDDVYDVESTPYHIIQDCRLKFRLQEWLSWER